MERSNFSYNIEDYNPDSEPEDWASKLVWKAETARQERLREEETRAKEAEKGLVEEEDGQFKLAEFDAESAGEAGKKVAEVVSGGSLKGEEIAGFEMKTKAPETGIKDTGHPERFEARERKNIESKTLVALISREPRALDAPGFWTSESDLERNKDAVEEMRDWLAEAEESEFETEAKKLVEHLPTGVAANGVEQSYDAIKDNNEALVIMYRETWDELKDEPA